MRAILNAIHLNRSRSWNKDRILSSQQELFLRIVAFAAGAVPHYRNSFSKITGGVYSLSGWDDFGRIPFLTKGDIKRSFPDRLVAEGLEWKSLYASTTSGTTDRVMVFQDKYKRDWDRAADLLLELKGNEFFPGQRTIAMPPDACVEVCGGENGRQDPSLGNDVIRLIKADGGERTELRRRLRRRLVRDYLWRVKILPSFSMHGTAPPEALLEEHVNTIAEWEPKTVKGFPTALYVLARYVKEKGRKLEGIRAIRPTGGKFSGRMAEAVSEAFGARVRENYGTAELGTIAFDCEECGHQHLLGELFHVEILRDGQPVGPGEIGEIVVTDLRNFACPLIRYKVGDVGRWHPGTCKCGFSGMRFTVDGRLEECLVTPQGWVITPGQIMDWILSNPGVAYGKLVQQSERDYLLEYVPSTQVGERASDADLQSGLAALLGENIKLKSRVLRSLAPETSGKYRMVMSRSFERLRSGLAQST